MRALRATLRRGVGRLAISPPVVCWIRRGLLRRINVVYIHYVGPPVPYYADFYTGLTVARFDRDLGILTQHFEVASLSDVMEQPPDRPEGSRPLLALTFDDGFDAERNGVMEVLERHGIRATSFVVTGMIGNVNLMWRNKLTMIRALRDERLYVRQYNSLMERVERPGIARGSQLLPASAGWAMGRKEEWVDALWKACDMPPLAEVLDEQRPYFTWSGLERWVAAGHDVGLHTATHPFCSGLDRDEVRAEIIEPAALLRERLGVQFLPFSYPFGVRLGGRAERELYGAGVFDGAFGVGGSVPRGTPACRLERAGIESDLAFEVFGRSLLERTFGRLAGAAVATS